MKKYNLLKIKASKLDKLLETEKGKKIVAESIRARIEGYLDALKLVEEHFGNEELDIENIIPSDSEVYDAQKFTEFKELYNKVKGEYDVYEYLKSFY